MSPERSSSAVRNLRSIFENKAVESTNDARGRSPSKLASETEPRRQRSQVRSSFFPVGPSMASTAEESEHEIPQQGEEGILESNDGADSTANPDKIVSAAEEAATLTPGDPTSTATMENGAHESGSGEPKPKKPDASSRTTGSSTTSAAAKKSTSSRLSVASKTSTNGTKDLPARPGQSSSQLKTQTTHVESSKRAGRSSLTAPTAAFLARAAAADRSNAAPEKPNSKPKPREVTKPLNISSHLTAPTAASRAKHEDLTSSASIAAAKPKPAPSKVAPRQSLAGRPESQTSSGSNRRSVGPIDGSFLDRMTRPTASSAKRTSDKPDVRSAPVKSKPVAAASTKSKAAGAVNTAKPTSKPAPTSARRTKTGPAATGDLDAKTSLPMVVGEQQESHERSDAIAVDTVGPHAKELKAENLGVLDVKTAESNTDAASPKGQQSEELKIENPKSEDPQVAEPKIEEPKIEEPKVEEPKVEGPKVEEPKIEEPKIEEPKIEEPKIEEPKIENAKTEAPKLEEPKAEEHRAEAPNAEESKVEEPKVEKTSLEQPKTQPVEAEVPETEKRKKKSKSKKSKLGKKSEEPSTGEVQQEEVKSEESTTEEHKAEQPGVRESVPNGTKPSETQTVLQGGKGPLIAPANGTEADATHIASDPAGLKAEAANAVEPARTEVANNDEASNVAAAEEEL